jgi:signal transduction histidine kinase
MRDSEHFVQFYEADEFLIDSLSGFIGAGLGVDDACIVVATQAHRESLEQRLRASGLDLGAASARGQYVSLDAGEILSTFMVAGLPEPRRFAEVLRGIIGRAAEGWRRVRIFGEMVALLWAEGHSKGALRLEELWNELHNSQAFTLFCAYPINGFGGEAYAELISGICAEHSRVIPAESYTRLADPDDRLRAIIGLQQKARSLEAEIAERKKAEDALRAVKDELALQVQDLRQLHDMSARLTSTLDIGSVLQEVLRAALAVHGTTLGLLSLCDEEQDGLTLKVSSGFEHAFLQHVEQVPPGGGACGTCYQQRRRVVVEDIEVDPIFDSYRAAARAAGFRACHSTPLIARSGAIVGVLSVHFRQPRRPSEREIRLMDLYAQMAADTIENAQLHHQVQQELAAREQLLMREQIARAEAESANRMKDQFFSVAAHELRTPLTTLMGQAQLFQRRADREGHLPERDQRTLRIVNNQIVRLNKLVLALLDVSRLEMGQLTIECEPLDVCGLARSVVREIAPTADDRRIELVCPDQPMLVNGDALRLEQVLQNLLQNALKYSQPPEAITVTITSQADQACVAVQDRGIGIPRDALPRLFQRFYRAQNVEQHISGMGIGLYVVREIVTLHGGSVAVESSEGQGSTFTVRLPLCAQPNPV